MRHLLGTIYNSLRTTPQRTVPLNGLNALLLFSAGGLTIWLWSLNAVTTGALAFTVGLVLRMQGMAHWILWEVAGLFEDIGTVQDGIETIARERSLVDVPDATTLIVDKGEISFDHVI